MPHPRFTFAINGHRTPLRTNLVLWICIALFALLWITTFIGTTDLNNWFIENMLTVLALVFLVGTFRRYQFSDMSYLLISIFLCMHIYGSQYTYAENPFGYFLKDLLHLERNHYDRLVHFAFGFLLAYPVREMIVYWVKYPRKGAWIFPILLTLSVSACYEMLEWAVADVFFKAQGPAYLGTQGDVWDAQKDAFLAVTGAIIATTIISRIKASGC